LRRQGRAGVDEAMIFDMVLARRRMVEEASSRSRRARLERARSARPGSGPVLPAGVIAPPGEAEHSAVTDADDTPLELPFYETEEWDD
jgi:putative transposase